MEWVETTAKTVDEAKDLALDRLGVDETEAEFEILEEPRPGLFGRIRGEARVRGRVKPKAPRAKDDTKRRRRPKKGDDAAEATEVVAVEAAPAKAPRQRRSAPAAAEAPSDAAEVSPSAGRPARDTDKRSRDKSSTNRPTQQESSVEEVSKTVESFLTGLTQAFGIDTGVTVQLEDDQLLATIEGKHGLLLGPKANTLDAIQELTRVTAQRLAPSSTRIKVDVGGYREARRLALVGFAEAAAARAIDEGVEVVLEPMNAADRKTVHDTINDIPGAVTRSAGAEPRRRVVVGPDPAALVKDEEE